MMGLDVHLDTNIGTRFSALGHTLTALAGEADEDEVLDESFTEDDPDSIFTPTKDIDMESITGRRTSFCVDNLPDFVYDTTMDPKIRFRLIEKEMNEQAHNVQVLK